MSFPIMRVTGQSGLSLQHMGFSISFKQLILQWQFTVRVMVSMLILNFTRVLN
jgi:hypothetical protein